MKARNVRLGERVETVRKNLVITSLVLNQKPYVKSIVDNVYMVIAVAIVQPKHYINVGYVARIMKNFGYYQLYLVDPHYNEEEALRFAMHGRDILASAKVISFKNLRKTFDALVGTTALSAVSRSNVVRDTIDSVQLANLLKSVQSERHYCIILGREASGLNNSELHMCDIVVAIQTGTSYQTLNISHALAILLYEIAKYRPQFTPNQNRIRRSELSSRAETDLFINYVKKTAKCCGYDLHKESMLYLAVKRLLARGMPTSKEVMLLISLLRKCILAIERGQKTDDRRP